MQTLKITFSTGFFLNFTVHNSNIGKRWAEALQAALEFPYPIDDPKRFYGFNDNSEEQHIAIERINKTIRTINEHEHLIDRTINDVRDQDTLNYLHHIFEVYHGLLNQQTHPYFLRAPQEVRKALADLNVDVHRCETSYRESHPRIVLTWYGLPKTRFYNDEDFNLITNQYKFGEVYLNYTEIGKTLTDYYMDNDQYIDPAGFRPLNHFSADIHIKFADINEHEANTLNNNVLKYFNEHITFFNELGYKQYNKQLRPGLIPVASIDSNLSRENILQRIKESQYVSKVELI